MELPLRKIAFVAERFALDTPAQQLLDRFLIGYPRNGEFHRCGAVVSLFLGPGAPDADVRRRIADFSLQRHETIESAVREANGIVVVPRGISSPELLTSAIQSAPKHAAVFVVGAIAHDGESAQRIVSLAASRNVALAAGMPIATTFRLPDVDLPKGAKVKDALIVVQGEFPAAELDALEGLLPILERRRDGESGVKRIRRLAPTGLWDSQWVPRPLLAAALSRSDSPQGDALKDGRTQDLVGLGLVPQLAQNPRGWTLEHTDGVRSTLLVLNGVVADANFAIRLADNSIISAQLYRPPPPRRHEFSRLAAVIEEYFRTGQSPSPSARGVLVARLLGELVKLG